MTLGENTVIQSINLKNEDNGTIKAISNKVIDSITDLLSNTSYSIIITTLTKDLFQTHEFYFQTRLVENPTVILDQIYVTETSVKVVPRIYFTVNTFKFNYIEIKTSKDNIVAKLEEEDIAYIFNNLLSSKRYIINYNYSYDLLDGNGLKTRNRGAIFYTNSFIKPSMEFKSIKVNKNSISFEVADIMDKIAPNYIETRLYKNSDLIETTKERKYTFTGLESDVTYLVETHYSYNLLDGNGDINETLRATVVTNENSIIYEEIK